MKLSSIIAYQNQLDKATPLNGVLIAHDRLAPLLHTIKSSDIELTHLVNRLGQDYKMSWAVSTTLNTQWKTSRKKFHT